MSEFVLRAAVIERVEVYLHEPITARTTDPYATVGYEGDGTRHVITRFPSRTKALDHRTSLLEKLPMLLMVEIEPHEPYRDLLP
jgi:hypothetical protein